MNTPKYPQVEVKLSGEDGNAFSILARVSRAMRKAGCAKSSIDEYQREAKSGDYDNLLQTTMRYVTVS